MKSINYLFLSHKGFIKCQGSGKKNGNLNKNVCLIYSSYLANDRFAHIPLFVLQIVNSQYLSTPTTLAFLFHIILRTSTDVWFIFFCRVKPSVYLFCFFIIIISSAYNPEKVGYARLAQGYKSSILVSLMVFSTKRHYIYLSKCLLRCTRISNDKNPRSVFFRF